MWPMPAAGGEIPVMLRNRVRSYSIVEPQWWSGPPGTVARGRFPVQCANLDAVFLKNLKTQALQKKAKWRLCLG